jgi:predicted ester cyclase
VASFNPGAEAEMKRVLAAGALVVAAHLPSARAETSVEAARASVAPFYKALNAAFAGDSADLIRQATAPDWVSCRGNDVCNSRDEVIAGVAARLKSVPDLKWEIKDVQVSGNQVIVRGEATGTPSGEFFGAAHTGKSFRIMSIDVHTIEGGKLVRSYHIEDWIGALRQLSTN